MRRRLLVAAILVAAAVAPTTAIAQSGRASRQELATYSHDWWQVHLHTRFSPGRNLRTAGDLTARDIKRSTDVLEQYIAVEAALDAPPPAPATPAAAPAQPTQAQPASNVADSAAASAPAPASLQAIAQCESSGNPSATNGPYGGLYQFDYQTWHSVGGTGDPASASPAEQTYRAELLMQQRGTQPWPVCGAGR